MKYSIIIPHKNSSLLLKRLLDSIPNLETIQVVVVDDGSSTDELNTVCSYKKHYNFELYQNESVYAGGARNTGIKKAIGKWLLFADSDDFYTGNFERLVDKYQDTDADVVYFNVESCYSDTLEPAYRAEHINELFSRYEKTRDAKEIKCRFLAPWSKMVNRDFVLNNNIWYEEIIAANDLMFNAMIACKSNKVLCESDPLYVITVAKGSITNTLSKDRLESRLQSVIRTNKVLKKYGYGKYQMSVLYYIGGAYQYGFGYIFHVLWVILKNGSNPFIGVSKLLHAKKVWGMLQNKKFINDKRNNNE